MGERPAGQRHDAGRPADDLSDLLPAPRPILARAVIGAGRGAWWTLRYAVFLPLDWVRDPVQWLLKWLAALSLVGFFLCLAFYVGPHRTYVLLGMLGVGLVSTAIKRSAYDAVLRWVRPK